MKEEGQIDMGSFAPCEFIVWQVLPRIRAQLTKELHQKGLAGKEIAARLGISQGAVSQYLSDKRGKGGNQLGDRVKRELQALAEEIVDGEGENLTPRVCKVCDIVKQDGTLCRLHRSKEETPTDCDICFPG